MSQKNVTYHDILMVSFNEIQKQYDDIGVKKLVIKEDINNDEKNIEIFNVDKKIMSAKYEVLGMYDSAINIFIWGDNLIPQLKEYAIKLKSYIVTSKFTDVDFMERALYYLSNNIMYVSKENINDLLILCTFITKKLILSQSEMNTNIAKKVVVYYVITDVLSM